MYLGKVKEAPMSELHNVVWTWEEKVNKVSQFQ